MNTLGTDLIVSIAHHQFGIASYIETALWNGRRKDPWVLDLLEQIQSNDVGYVVSDWVYRTFGKEPPKEVK